MANPYEELQSFYKINAPLIDNSLAPLVQSGQNDVQLAALQYQRQKQLEDMAQRNFFAQQLVSQQQQFQQSQAQQQQRAQMGLLEKGAQLRSQEAEKEFKLRTDEKHADERRKRLQTLYQYGGDVSPDASDFEIEQNIQDRAGQSLANVFNTMGGLEKQIMAQSEEDPKVTEAKVAQKMLLDPKFSKLLENYPDLRKQFVDGRVNLNDAYDHIAKTSAGFFGPGSDSRTNTYLSAATMAKQALAAEEAANPDARKRPGYLQALNSYQILQKEAAKHIDALRTPDRVLEAVRSLAPTKPVPAASVPSKVQTVFQALQAGQPGAVSAPAAPPAAAVSPIVPVAYPDLVANALKSALNDFTDLVPAEAKPYIAGRRQAMSPETADSLLNSYITNLRSEIARIQAQPGERGKSGRIAPLQRELERVSNLLSR